LIKTILLALVMGIILTSALACNKSQALPAEGKTWLSPGKIQIDNLRHDNSVKQKIKIHNGNKQAAKFSIYYRIPDYVENNFIAAPADARDWVIIDEDSPVLAPEEIKEIQVVLDLPGNTQTTERWEFWTGVRENKENMLATELCIRWLITMSGS
jgi:hypothetical protein